MQSNYIFPNGSWQDLFEGRKLLLYFSTEFSDLLRRLGDIASSSLKIVNERCYDFIMSGYPRTMAYLN